MHFRYMFELHQMAWYAEMKCYRHKTIVPMREYLRMEMDLTSGTYFSRKQHCMQASLCQWWLCQCIVAHLKYYLGKFDTYRLCCHLIVANWSEIVKVTQKNSIDSSRIRFYVEIDDCVSCALIDRTWSHTFPFDGNIYHARLWIKRCVMQNRAINMFCWFSDFSVGLIGLHSVDILIKCHYEFINKFN